MIKGLTCGSCGRELENVSTGFTGADWGTQAGEGSGFDYEIRLDCKCGRTYHIGNTKGINDFSPSKYLKEV